MRSSVPQFIHSSWKADITVLYSQRISAGLGRVDGPFADRNLCYIIEDDAYFLLRPVPESGIQY